MNAENTPRHLHLWSGLIVLGIFLAGAASGIGLTTWLRPHHHSGPRSAGHHGFLEELHLTPEQREKARAIFEKHRPAIETAMREAFPKVRAEQDKMDEETRALLTPEQAKRFDELRAERNRHPFHGPGHMRPPPEGSPPGDQPPEQPR